jgi:large subunit ribosomal protein L15
MNIKTVCDKGQKHTVRKRVGRGIGSGLGKTAGRGHKGLNARSGASRRPGYEGGQMPIYRRVPKRGFTNARFRVDYTVINVDALNAFADGDTVDFAAILARGLASQTEPVLKVLGSGELKRKLNVRAQKFSASAKTKIESAGGTAVLIDARGTEVPAEEAKPQVQPKSQSAAKAEPQAKPSSKTKSDSSKPDSSQPDSGSEA